jgi:hypothetical protein
VPDLTPEQEKALIEAVTTRTWVDGWERGLTEEQRDDAAYYFLAGVKWAEAVTRQLVEDVLEDVKELLEAGVQCGEARTEITYLMPTAEEAIAANTEEKR